MSDLAKPEAGNDAGVPGLRKSADPGAVFQQLAELIYADESPEAIYAAITRAAVALVDGCDHASIMQASNGRFATAAASDDIARQIDALEREVGTGPCVDAILDEAFQLDTDIQTHSQWPELAERIVAHSPVRGMLGFRILADNRKVGALNLFSDRSGAFTNESANQGAVVAAFASVAFMLISARNQASTMSRGLESNREIGKAIGLLMAAHHFDEDRAFEVLRTTSQNLNMKLSAVARKVIEGQQSQYSGQKPPKPNERRRIGEGK